MSEVARTAIFLEQTDCVLKRVVLQKLSQGGRLNIDIRSLNPIFTNF